MSFAISGADNFRSLHGLPTQDARRLAGHKILRSDHLVRLTGDDWDTLVAMGLKTICDLRGPVEREMNPSRIPQGDIRELQFNLVADVRADARYAEMLHASELGDDRERAVAMMLAIYRQIPHVLAPNLRTLFEVLGDGDVPILVHCSAGKDRTGFVVAVILHALGADRSTILDDYLLSGQSMLARDPARRARIENSLIKTVGHCTAPMLDAVLDVQESYLQAAFDEVDRCWGSLDAYLEREGGLDAARLRQLRDHYLSESDAPA